MFNERKDTYCERVFAQWVDMENLMRENNIKLFSLETKTSLDKFDFVAFTLQYEMSYTNILNMLELAGLPLLAKERTEGMPFVIAGGPCAYNAEPITDFFDFFVMGEGEEVNMEITDAYIEWKEKGVKFTFATDLHKVPYPDTTKASELLTKYGFTEDDFALPPRLKI